MWKPREKKCKLRDDTPKRFSKADYKAYQDYIRSIGVCQVCEVSTNLDAPHHTKQGLGNKDDRSLICICVECHAEIHTLGFSSLDKTRAELEEIGLKNWKEYKCE